MSIFEEYGAFNSQQFFGLIIICYSLKMGTFFRGSDIHVPKVRIPGFVFSKDIADTQNQISKIKYILTISILDKWKCEALKEYNFVLKYMYSKKKKTTTKNWFNSYMYIYSLWKHAFSNILKFLPLKNENFQWKILIIFIFLLKT